MFDAIGRVDHTRLGFTAIPIDAQVRVEWHPMFDKAYDVMLHIDGKTSRTVAFKRTAQDYEWIAEQEILKGADELTLGDVDPYLNKWAVHRFECTQNDAVRL